MMKVNQIIHGDCLQVLYTFPSNMVDSVVTDSPYGLTREPDIREVLEKWLAGEDYIHRGSGFMGKTWDSFVPGPSIWREVYRVLKPGGHALVFAGTRTQDLMTTALRLAGFEVRDVIEWLYFGGFPKSMDVSKAIDKKLGAKRDVIGVGKGAGKNPKGFKFDDKSQSGGYLKSEYNLTAPATELARKWDGWGTSAKPSHEPVIVATKPKTVEDILDEKLKEVANCLSLFVKIAVQNLTLNLQDYVEELDFARNRVEPKNSIQDVLSGVTDTLRLKTITENINWNIVLSCLITLGDRLKNGNTSTTEMTLNAIIELKTLRYFQSLTTLESIIKDATSRSGERINAETVAGHLNEELLRLSEILTSLVPENAMSKQEEKDSFHKHEPIILARKPLDGTVADNVERWGTGAINIDGCRIGNEVRENPQAGFIRRGRTDEEIFFGVDKHKPEGTVRTIGRFPANCVTTEPDAFFSKYFNVTPPGLCKKASKRDRNSDWQGEEITLEEKRAGYMQATVNGSMLTGSGNERKTVYRNTHPTVKPTNLMAWLVRLITPPGGIVLDPFAGSGSTCVAARREGFFFIGIEQELEYVEIARKRVGEIDTVPG